MPKSQRGRPPQGNATGLTRTFTMRLPEDLRAALKEEARRNRRSENQEAIVRLRSALTSRKKKEAWTFAYDEERMLALLIERLAFGPRSRSQQSWLEDRWTFEAYRHAISEFISFFAPDGDLRPPATTRPETDWTNDAAEYGRSVARGLYASIQSTVPAPELEGEQVGEIPDPADYERALQRANRYLVAKGGVRR